MKAIFLSTLCKVYCYTRGSSTICILVQKEICYHFNNSTRWIKKFSEVPGKWKMFLEWINSTTWKQKKKKKKNKYFKIEEMKYNNEYS